MANFIYRTHAVVVSAVILVLPACGILSSSPSDYREQDRPLDSFREDRPKAENLLGEYPALEDWLAGEMARSSGNYRLVWDDERPPGGALASHSYLKESDVVVLRVRRDLKPADQLAALVFEICNARNYPKVSKLLERAKMAGVAREAIVDGILELELGAARRARGVLEERMALSAGEREGLVVYNALMDAPESLAGYEAWHRKYSGGAGSEGVREFYLGQLEGLDRY